MSQDINPASLHRLAGQQASDNRPFEELGTASVITFTEGPTCDNAGNVFFTDVRGNKIMKLAPTGELSIFRYPANYANGLVCTADDLLWACEEGEDGNPCVSVTNLATRSRETIVSQVEGKRLRGPKDITFDSQGRVYFTDGSRPFFLEPFADPALHRPGSGVYRIDPDRQVTEIIGPGIAVEPNGICVSPDDKTIYVIENNPRENGLRLLLAFDLGENGDVSNRRVVHDFKLGRSGDGMSVDGVGRLWVAAGLNRGRGLAETLDNPAGIYVFEPDGTLIDILAIPEDSVTNNCFGGPDLRTLYVTAGKTLFSTRVDVPGTRK